MDGRSEIRHCPIEIKVKPTTGIRKNLKFTMIRKVLWLRSLLTFCKTQFRQRVPITDQNKVPNG